LADLGPVARALFCALIAGGLLRSTSRRRQRLLFALCAAALVLTMAAPTWRTLRAGVVRDYTWAHYRLGAAFFDELGYTDMYGAMLGADRAGHWAPGGPAPIRTVRDLRTYGHGPPPAGPSLTPAVQQQLEQEVAFFQPRLGAGEWRSFFRDKGYNGTPAWWATSGRVVAGVPLTPGWLRAVGLADLALAGLALLALGLSFGPGPALLAGAWIGLYYGVEGQLVGGPLQLDFLLLATLGLCALQRGRPGLGGALLGWSTALRIFPVVLLAAPVLAAATRWHQVARIPSGWRRFLVGFAASALLLAALGSASPRGPGAWIELSDKLSTHSALHHLGDKRIGLAPLLAWTPQGELTDAQAREERAARWPARVGAHRAGMSLLAACWVAAVIVGVRRRHRGLHTHEDEARDLVPLLLLGLGLVFLLLPLSRYYVLLPALLLALPTGSPAARRIAAALFLILGLTHVAIAAGLPDATVYAVANLGWLGLWSLVLGSWAWGPPWDRTGAPTEGSASPSR